jgi:hypothetical protein
MRDFVLSHPDYKQDSIVSSTIANDLIKDIDELYRDIDKRTKYFGKK